MNKRIQFDRQTRDFAAYLDGVYIGSFGSHQEAQSALDAAAFEELTRG